MSVRVRCNCGWNSQVSDFYLGDHVCCPECGAKLDVNLHSGIPYGYPPYQMWAKKTPAPPGRNFPRFPEPRANAHDLVALAGDPHAGGALMLGIISIFGVLTVCGMPVAAVLAVFGLCSASASRRWSAEYRRPVDGRTQAGAVLSITTLVIAAMMVLWGFMGAFTSSQCVSRPVVSRPHVRTQQTGLQSPPQLPRYRYPDAKSWAPPPSTLPPAPGRRYSDVPVPKSGQPRNEFERRQIEFSNRVREQREHAAVPKPLVPTVPKPVTPTPPFHYGK